MECIYFVVCTNSVTTVVPEICRYFVEINDVSSVFVRFSVSISATSYERHLPMEEAFPDAGFDTSQFHRYMEHHFR